MHPCGLHDGKQCALACLPLRARHPRTLPHRRRRRHQRHRLLPLAADLPRALLPSGHSLPPCRAQTSVGAHESKQAIRELRTIAYAQAGLAIRPSRAATFVHVARFGSITHRPPVRHPRRSAAQRHRKHQHGAAGGAHCRTNDGRVGAAAATAAAAAGGLALPTGAPPSCLLQGAVVTTVNGYPTLGCEGRRWLKDWAQRRCCGCVADSSWGQRGRCAGGRGGRGLLWGVQGCWWGGRELFGGAWGSRGGRLGWFGGRGCGWWGWGG